MAAPYPWTDAPTLGLLAAGHRGVYDGGGIVDDQGDELVRKLAAEVERLSARVEELEGRAEAPRPATPDERPRTRRELLVGLGAAAAATATTAIATAPPAAAATGDPVKAGQTTTASSSTSVKWDGAGGFTGVMLLANDTTFTSDNGTLFPAATGGWAGGTTAGVANGVFGYTRVAGGNAVVGFGEVGGCIGGRFFGDRANLALPGAGVLPIARTDPHNAGEVVVDNTFSMWLCTAGGTPGTWREVGGPTSAGSLHVFPAPIRAYDSREAGDPKLSNGTRDVSLPAIAPTGSTAVVVNLTVVETVGSGFLAVASAGVAAGSIVHSNLNWFGSNQILAGSALSAVSASTNVNPPKLRLKAGGGGAAHVVVDVFGYYR